MKRGLGILLMMIFWYGETVHAQLDSVSVCFEKIKLTSEDSVRLKYANDIEHFIQSIAFGGYHLDTPIKYLGYKKSDEAGIELYSWAIPLEKGQAFYNLFRLEESGRNYLIKSLPGDEKAWLFYDFVPFEHQKQSFLILLGWSKTQNTNKKTVLVASFKPNGKVSFNHPLLCKGKSRSASLTFEYGLEGSMLLKPDKKGKRIIFDHLAPFDQKYEGYFMFYGPDASYDALVLKKGEWWYEENVKD